ncbi:prolyl-tRNA synthetase [Sulfurifustis variabilis]|uniref:Prolyl-tRNA synthetase n=1 Tax=Sulfurifustis variabilis TaxID=1675686 RepID=A0A1B4V2Z4_9GAMM|nr:YbaK/EbsC family protein [Sulfurifustis variabilis]BAU47715.1 prolyl-tRNA synthetase [Sulfurifustis variabilis]
MTIAKTVENYLQQNRVAYDVVPHPHTSSTRGTVQTAHVPADRVAKAVVLHDAGGGGYVMAVVPGSRHVSVKTLSKKLGRELNLAGEDSLVPVFKDCAVGAIPPLGPAYGMETIVDDSLVGVPEIYFEAGDHEELIRVKGEQFLSLLREARHGQFTH